MEKRDKLKLLFLMLFIIFSSSFIIFPNPQVILANGQSADQAAPDQPVTAQLVGIKLTKHLKSINDNNTLREYSSVGDKLVYEIRIVNSTNNVKVHQLQVIDSQAKTGPSYVSGDNDNNGILDPQETWIYEASYIVTQEDLDRGSLTKSARATGVVEYTDDETVSARQGPALELIKEANKSFYSAVGEKITYSFKIKNIGNVTLHNILVTDSLLGIKLTGQEIRSLAPGESDSKTFTAKYTVTEADIKAGEIINTAEVQASDPKGTPVLASSKVIVNIMQADLSIEKQVVTSPVTAGEDLEYWLIVRNHGPNDASKVMVNYIPPSALSNVTYSIDSGEWINWPSDKRLFLGGLADGGKIVIKIKGHLSSLVKGEISGRATVSAFETDPYLSNNEDQTIIPLNVSADLIIDLTGPETLIAGREAEYVLTVTNRGPSIAENVRIEAFFDEKVFGNLRYSTDNGKTWQPWTGEYFYSETDLNVGESFRILIRGTVSNDITPGTTVKISARVKADTPDPRLNNNINILIASTEAGPNQSGPGDNDDPLTQPPNPAPAVNPPAISETAPGQQPSDNPYSQEIPRSAEHGEPANQAQTQTAERNDQRNVEIIMIAEGEAPQVQSETESESQSEEIEQGHLGDGGDGKKSALPKTAGLALAYICAFWLILLGCIALKKGYPKGFFNRQ